MASFPHAFLVPLIRPLGEAPPPPRRPWATWALLAVSLGLVAAHYHDPARTENLFALDSGSNYQYLTYFFVHVNFAIWLLDALLLWRLAAALEGRCGPWRMLALVAAAGVAGGAVNKIPGLRGVLSLMGASAVICGLLAAVLVALLKDRDRDSGRGFWIAPVVLALVYCGLEAVLARLAASETPLARGPLDLSLAAHLGGLAGGAGLAALMLKRRALCCPQSAAIPTKAAPKAPLLSMPLFVASPALDLFDPAGAAVEPDPLGLLEGDDDNNGFDDLPAPQPVGPPSLGSLFGDPSESQFGALTPRLAPTPRPTVILKNAPEEIGPISFDQTGGGIDAPIKPAEPEPVRPAAPAPAAPPPEAPPLTPHPAALPPEAEPKIRPNSAPAVAAPVKRGGVTMRQVSLSEFARRAPEPEDDDPVAFSLEPSDETQDRAAALKDDTDWSTLRDGRFSVVLAPGCAHDLRALAGSLAELLNLTPKGAAHALAHRHGIMADNLPRTEAERIADALAKAGHTVLVVALTSRIQFGEALELHSIKEQGDHLRLLTAAAEPIIANWRQIIFLAAGQASPGAGTPSRRALDLFLIQPRHHLRVWEHSFGYTPQAPGFRELARQINERAAAAFHTRSLDKWLKDESAPLRQFAGLSEYDHYLRWHLMANLAPSKAMKNEMKNEIKND